MIRLFRKIRFKLFVDNKVGKYLIYAIVEVLIVVIGILIALQINNWNQQRLTEEKINRLFLEIRKNLVSEIETAENVVEFYSIRDSIIQRVVDKKLTREEFASPTINSPQYAIMVLRHFAFNRNAYDNLTKISDKIPAKYESLYWDLKILYDARGELIKERKSKLEAKYYPYQEYLRYNKEWTFDLLQFRELDEDAIDYFIKDPFYFNQVIEIQDDIRKYKNAIYGYKTIAAGIIKQILELELKEY